jgi:ATP-dependent helicase/nuclease subunit A
MGPARAIYAFRRNLVVAASAGTGKTHALVGVAVHLLLGACASTDAGLREPILPDGLIATTFSRKAATEIRDRLARELERIAEGDPQAAYRADLDAAYLRGAGSLPSDEVIALRARTALARLPRARIGTLHSFAGAVLRDHALAAGLSPAFAIADEETARGRAIQSIERVLERHLADGMARDAIRVAGGVRPLVDLLRRLLERIGEDGRPASELELGADDAARLDANMNEMLHHAQDLVGDPKLGPLAQAVCDARVDVESARFELAVGALFGTRASGKRSDAAEAFYTFRRSLPTGPTNAERGRRLVRRWWVRGDILPRASSLRDLLVACEHEIAADNARDSILGFSDVLRGARDVLRDNPAIAAEVGRGASALLVDEFQDTSPLQRDLVQLVWDRDPEARTRGRIPSPTELRNTGLMIVGDRKQSIYSFRGADVAVFAEVCVALAGAPARLALGIPHGLVPEPATPAADFVALRHNRRGAPALLDFANAFSRRVLRPAADPPRLYEIDYVPETEDLLSPAPEGPVEYRTRWLRPAVRSDARNTSSLEEADAIAARISCIVRGGELTVRGVPARFQDIAILAKRHSMLDVAAYALARDGIPHVVAGMGFFGTREVRDLAAMLACLIDPDDSLARAEVLRGPWAGVTDRTLVGLTDEHQGLADVDRWSLGERRHLVDPGDRGAVNALGALIAGLRPVVESVGAGAALREAVQTLELEETLILLPRGEQRVANVRKLLALADEAADARQFLRRLRQSAAEEQKEGEAATFSEDDDAVRLLTIHASKGLAFPIVFLPEAGATSRSHVVDPVLLEPGVAGKASVLVSRIVDGVATLHDTPSYAAGKAELMRREAAERRRLSYVAATRASHAMFFVGDRAPSKSAAPTCDGEPTAVVLGALVDPESQRIVARLEVETGEALERRVAATYTARSGASEVATLPASAMAGPLRLRGEDLLEAAHCARLFQLVHSAGAPSIARPVSTGENAVRRVLAAAGEWGRAIAAKRPTVLFGERAVLRVGTDRDGDVLLDVAIDALVAWADGSCDAIALASEPLVMDRYRLYAAFIRRAAALRRPEATIRVGVIGEATPPMEGPQWLGDVTDADARLREAASRTLPSSLGLLAPRSERSVCDHIACPYRVTCYLPPATGARSFVDRGKQLRLDLPVDLGPPRRRRAR